jgi:gluconate 2-dehydrogenase gamma chain
MISRRYFLGAAGGVAATWLGVDRPTLRQALEDAAHAASLDPPAPFRVLTAEAARDLDALTAQILPTDDLPGAREANIVRFIDQALAGFAGDRRVFIEQGLRDLAAEARRVHPQAESFADLTVAQQIELLHALEASGSAFFEEVRQATLVGMFADPTYGGNAGKVGWKLLGFDDRFAWQPPFGDYDA